MSFHSLRLKPARGTRVVMLFVVLRLLGGCHKPAESAPDIAVSVTAQHPTIGPITQIVEADATLAPRAQASLASRISAPIRKEFVQRGDRVHRGQLLITLESRDLQGAALDSKGNLISAQAAYTVAVDATNPEQTQTAKADVVSAQAARDLASRTAEERRRLYQQGALSGREADASATAAVQAQAVLDAAQEHLRTLLATTRKTNTLAAQGQLTSAEGRLEGAEAQANYADLRSPLNGIVTDRPLYPGDTAAAGTPIVTIMDTTSLIAKLHVAQATAQQLRLGGEAEVSVPGITTPIKADVSLISPALDPGSTTVEVWLTLPNPDGRLKAGTPVHALIHADTVTRALCVPTVAIVPGTNEGTAVMLVGPDHKAHKQAVQVGIRTPKSVQITTGLSPSDVVIVAGGYGLDEGTTVVASSNGSASKDHD